MSKFPKEFNMIPRNEFDFEGGVVLFSKDSDTFYHIWFGSGDNLDDADIEDGYDDYMNYESYRLADGVSFEDAVGLVKDAEGYLDEIECLEEEDGGMMLIKRAEYGDSGDIRDYLENALEMANYGVSDLANLYKDLVFVCVCS